MLIHIYNQLLIMSVVAGGLYLLLKLLSRVTFKYFTMKWHYYSYLMLYTFFLIPYHKWLSWLDLSFVQEADKGMKLSPLPPIAGLNPTGPINPIAKDMAKLQEEGYSATYLNFSFMPYLLIAGTLIYIAVILIQYYKLNRRILKMSQLTGNPQIVKQFSICRKELGIRKDIPVYVSPYISTPFFMGCLSRGSCCRTLNIRRKNTVKSSFMN